MFQKTKIKVLASHKSMLSAYSAEHVLFTVNHGTGKLRSVWYDEGVKNYDGNMAQALLFDDVPLVQMQSTGCPTCATLLAAGYGISEKSCEIEQMRQAIFQPYCGLEDALKRLHPLLGLLTSGIYILTQSMLYPTDGEGHFFWNVSENFTPYLATSQFYDSENFRVLPSFPSFLYPSQSAQKYDAQRVNYYRKQIQCGQSIPKVIAYCLKGSMCVLLDGHHRACACALEGVQVPSLIITEPKYYRIQGTFYLLWPDESKVDILKYEQYRLKKYLNSMMLERKSERYPFFTNTHNFQRNWEAEYTKMAMRYPHCCDVGLLMLYPDIAFTVEGIQKLVMENKDITAAVHLLRCIVKLPDIDQKEVAIVFTSSKYPHKLRRAAFEALSEIKDDFEIDEMMIDILVNCEDRKDPIYQIANRHWDH